MSRSGLNRKTALATATLVIAAEITDVDLLYRLGGPVVGFQHHRGWTHSFAAVPVMAALAVALVWGWRRLFRKERAERGTLAIANRPDLPVRWGLLYGYACLAALTHLLLDYITSYGIRLFEPFSFKWYSWDIVYTVDPFMWLVLGLGLAVPTLFGLIHAKSGAHHAALSGRRGAVLGLLAIVLMWGFRDYQHRHVVTELNAQRYHGEKPVRADAYPYAWNPFVWHGVIETRNFFETLQVNTLGGDLDPEDAVQTYDKPEETPITIAAKKSGLGRVYLDWARYPMTESTVVQGSVVAYRVRFYDLRSIRRLYASVDLDKNLHVLAQRFRGQVQN